MSQSLQPSRHNWLIVFYISAGVYVVGTLAYSLMATGVEQEWNKISLRTLSNESNQRLSSDSIEE